MKQQSPARKGLTRRQALALLGALGVARDALSQDAPAAAPRSFRVVLDNDRVRVLEYRSRPGFGVCGEGMHSHPDHVTVSLTGALPSGVTFTPAGRMRVRTARASSYRSRPTSHLGLSGRASPSRNSSAAGAAAMPIATRQSNS